MAFYACDQVYGNSSTVKQTAILLKVPVEVLHHVCSQLEPVWLLKLASTCAALRTVLSFEHGNKVWYNVLPTSMWKDAEQFQDEAELSRVFARQGCSLHAAQGLVPQPLFRRRQQLKPSLPSLSSSTIEFPPALSILTGTIRFPQVQYDLSPTHYDASSSKSMHHLVTFIGERKPNQALGGPYSPLCNYKREVLGNLNLKRRCYVCLNSKGSDGKNVHIWRWNLLFCQDCYKAYTLTIGALRLMPTILPVVHYVQNQVYNGSANTEIYFKPEIDHLLTIYTGLDFDTNLLIYRRGLQEVEKYRRQTSILEARRRVVRRLIVAAAEQMWEGIDPCPTPIVCAETAILLAWTPRPTMPTELSFEVFRGRFAPTKKLKNFLFPDYALSDTPYQLPYNPATGWMDDPTMSLKKSDDFYQLVTATWICEKALNMLSGLTDWRHPEYYRKGRGGYVTNWMEAVKKWHIARLEAKLRSGAIVCMENVSRTLQGSRHYWRIHKLRTKLGMQDEGAKTMTRLPKHPERGIAVSHEAYAEFYRLDKLASEAEWKRIEGVLYFNKIIRHTCVACPETSLLLYPMGFEGMLEHIRIWHPKLYFTSDDFQTVG